MISLDDVSVTRGDQSVLESVSASVSEGEFVGLVGPNGAGKTTLLQTINGVLAPDSGTVTVGGLDVRDASARELSRRVATVPQEATVGFEFDVRDIVEMGRTPYASRLSRGDYREDRRQVEAALERTETAAFADRSIRAISGGERQRVLLARALAQDTPALVLDEPTASLDINHQVRTLSLVADLVAEGKTAIAAIHDLDLAARFCDRLFLLANGSVAASGDPATVLDSRYLDDAFDTATAVATDPVTGTPSVTAMTDPPDRDPRVHVIGSGPVAATVLARLHEAGLSVTVGPLPDGDVALETARGRTIEALSVPPFGTVDADTERRLIDHIEAAAATVLVDPPLDPAGTVAEAAADTDQLIAVESDPATGRASDRSSTAYERLRDRAVVTPPTSVLETVVSTAPEQELSADD
ncbi:ATP-binding cassette domain-containing protein [Halorientalis salina]|uniref:ATP-binding cassette domain-containing protein n=1 Tax=Halorientalis salina TaxID=2932266 RepID=UPI0010AC213A|nr:ATP-binding cassette domain-containing protein [Halorientalis salina]